MKNVVRAVFCSGLVLALVAHAEANRQSSMGRPGNAIPDSRAPLPNPAGTPGSPVAVSEGFDNDINVLGGGIFANGWIRQNNSDQPNDFNAWTQGSAATFTAVDGADDSWMAADFSATNLYDGTISDWLLTPAVTFGNGAMVSFYTRTLQGSFLPDRLQVRACSAGPCTNLGTSPEDVGDFDTLLLDIDPGEAQGIYPEQWTQFTIGATDGLPTSGTGRIAFRYYVHDSGPDASDGTPSTHGNLVALDRVVVTTSADAASPMDLAVTLSPADAANPNACGTATTLDVAAGDQVNVCYTIANNSPDTFVSHSLRDDVNGILLTQQPHYMPPATTYQYNRIVTVDQTQSLSSTWTAFPQSPSVTWYLQPQANTYAYNWNYYSNDPTPFIDITDGALLPVVGSSPITPFPQDFNFLFYGRPISQFCALFQGIFEEVPDGGACNDNIEYLNQTLPNQNFALNPAMLIYWAEFQQAGNIYYKLVGDAPNRQFIVEWAGVQYTFGATEPLYAEIVLNEGVNTIEYRYNNVVFGIPGLPNYDYGGAATIGMQNQYLEDFYSYRTESLEGLTRLIWTPVDPTVYTNTRQVQINAGQPAITLNPSVVTATATSHGAATQTIAIDNGGNGRLDWSVETAAAPSNMPVIPHFVLPLGERSDVSFGKRPGAATATSEKAPTAPFGGGAQNYMYAVDLLDIGGPYLIDFSPEDGYLGNVTGYVSSGTAMTGATFLNNDFSKLYTVDAINNHLLWYDLTQLVGSEHIVGTIGIPADLITGIKQDPISGVTYLSTADGQSSGLWVIDPATANVRAVGTTTDAPGIIDIAFDAQGNLYGVDIVLDALVAIDKTSGEAQPIGSLGFNANFASGLAVDYATGLLYFASVDGSSGASGLWTIDTMTGQATLISPISGIDGVATQWDALAIAHAADTPCTDPSNVPWLQLGTLGGVIPAGGDPMTVIARFDASTLADGTYSADVCVHSNDPLRLNQVLPVTFTVGGGNADAIFANGFDDTAQ